MANLLFLYTILSLVDRLITADVQYSGAQFAYVSTYSLRSAAAISSNQLDDALSQTVHLQSSCFQLFWSSRVE